MKIKDELKNELEQRKKLRNAYSDIKEVYRHSDTAIKYRFPVDDIMSENYCLICGKEVTLQPTIYIMGTPQNLHRHLHLTGEDNE